MVRKQRDGTGAADGRGQCGRHSGARVRRRSPEDLNLNATLDTVVTYSYPILGTRQVSVHFEARNDAQGVPQWFKTIETTARLSVQ